MAITYVTPDPPAQKGHPDISMTPSYEKWQARAARRLKTENLPKTVPKGFPAHLTGDLVWDGDSIQSYDWTYALTGEQLSEVDDALAHFQNLNLPLGYITPETFPLPQLHSKLRSLSRELHDGHGFFVIRGLNVDKHNTKENAIIHAGISAHIAPQRARQDHKFDGKPADVVFTHIKDLTQTKAAGSIGSSAYTTDKQEFHTDTGEIVSLMALEEAADGGASKLASTWRVYNEIASTRPDLIHTLIEQWPMENFESLDKPWTDRPLVFHFPETETTPERIALQYARRFFLGFGALPRRADIPSITDAQAEALDTLHFLGEKFCVRTNFQKGDIQYINNLALFHGRDGFVNTPEKTRHLTRLWLRDPEYAWQTPYGLEWRWDELFKGVTPENQVFSLEPFVRSAANKSR